MVDKKEGGYTFKPCFGVNLAKSKSTLS